MKEVKTYVPVHVRARGDRGGKKVKNFRLKRREDRAIQQILQIEALETRMLL